jgi:hypothetical protein
MKLFKLCTSIVACTAIIFYSCNSAETKTDETTTDTSVKKEEPAPPPPAAPAKPANVALIWHKVANFAKWMVAYDGHDSARLAAGLHSYVIARDEPDTNMVMLAMKSDDLAKAKAFSKDPGLKKAMQKGGVVGAPTIKFYTMVFQDTAAIDSKLRSATMFKVKDWDAWKKSFDSTHALKTDNGLMLRSYGYDPDDNHNVVLVAAVVDTAKAHAYWNSDMLKQRRAASGVVGKPERVVYTVVKRY